jgi:hypothetical protein
MTRVHNYHIWLDKWGVTLTNYTLHLDLPHLSLSLSKAHHATTTGRWGHKA